MEITLPTKYRQITIKRLADYHAAADDFGRIAAITGHTYDEVKAMPVSVITKCKELIEQVMAKEGDEARFYPVHRVRLSRFRSKLIGFIPNIEACTTDEYLEFVTLAHPDRIKKSLLQLACLCFRPVTMRVGKAYQIQPYDPNRINEYSDVVGRMSAADLSGVMAFFLHLRREQQKSSLRYLESQLAKMKKLTNEALSDFINQSQRSGGGTTSS